MAETDITGMKFNHLTAIRRVYGHANGKDNYWEFECDCGSGKKTISKKYDVIHGKTTSCGCYKLQRVKESVTKHGWKGTRIYKVWNGMLKRCNSTQNKNYGGRGIDVCQEWKGENGFVHFRNWAYWNDYDEDAPRGECTLDRRNNDLGYSPENCRWVDVECQDNNKRNVHHIEAFGKSLSPAQWARLVDLSETTIKDRIFKRGMNPEEALTKPDMRRKYASQQAH